MGDIVERLRSPANVFYEYAADNGAMLREAADEIERLREALREIAKTDIQTWAKTALEKGDWVIVERIAEVDQQGIACRALEGVEARAALREKE